MKRGNPYLADGNIKIVTLPDRIVFRVHKSLLVGQSQTFNAFFSERQSSFPTLEIGSGGVVKMREPAADVSNLLLALNDGVYVSSFFLSREQHSLTALTYQRFLLAQPR